MASRTASAVKDRWTKEVLPDTLLFAGIFGRIEANPPSGTGTEDWERTALAEFKIRSKSKGEFRFTEVWSHLKSKPKWVQVTGNDSANGSNVGSASSSSLSCPTPNENTPTRPEGSKSAKRGRSNEQSLRDLVKEKRKITNLYRKKVKIASHDLQLRIISQLQDGPEKQRLLNDLLTKNMDTVDDDLKGVDKDEDETLEVDDDDE